MSTPENIRPDNHGESFLGDTSESERKLQIGLEEIASDLGVPQAPFVERISGLIYELTESIKKDNPEQSE